MRTSVRHVIVGSRSTAPTPRAATVVRGQLALCRQPDSGYPVISIVLEDESGRIEARFPDSALLDDLLTYASDGSRCLAFVDPYGDTVFNQLQVPVFAQELRSLAVAGLGSGLDERIAALVQFVEGALEQPHIYVRCIGD